MNLKKNIVNFIIIIIIFLIDRLSKVYILNLTELNNGLDIYVNPYLNFYLIWNKGIAFGLLSFDADIIYNLISILIALICVIIFITLIKSRGLMKYSLMSVFGGAISNLFDRLYYSAVPDFIDIHLNNYHWFIFNVADIFITIGVISMIYAEIFLKKGSDEKIF
jgi:signal peptidase II